MGLPATVPGVKWDGLGFKASVKGPQRHCDEIHKEVIPTDVVTARVPAQMNDLLENLFTMSVGKN